MIGAVFENFLALPAFLFEAEPQVHLDASLVEGNGAGVDTVKVQLIESVIDKQAGGFGTKSFVLLLFVSDDDTKGGVAILLVNVVQTDAANDRVGNGGIKGLDGQDDVGALSAGQLVYPLFFFGERDGQEERQILDHLLVVKPVLKKCCMASFERN